MKRPKYKHFKTSKQLVEHAVKQAIACSDARDAMLKVVEEEREKMRMKAFYKQKLNEGLNFRG